VNVRFVTGNPGKAAEAQAALAPLGIHVEPVDERTHEIQADTLEEVARAKAEALRARVPPPYFVEDAGLFVRSLQGFPGVYSAYVYRTLGNAGLLRLLPGHQDRRATFRAVIAYVVGDGPPELFVGEAPGTLAPRQRGSNGFGFDPIFVPRGLRRTFAELSQAEKSRHSHRGRALAAFASSLRRTTSPST
jgi:XTP/dITP diphosphohydrolase